MIADTDLASWKDNVPTNKALVIKSCLSSSVRVVRLYGLLFLNTWILKKSQHNLKMSSCNIIHPFRFHVLTSLVFIIPGLIFYRPVYMPFENFGSIWWLQLHKALPWQGGSCTHQQEQPTHQALTHQHAPQRGSQRCPLITKQTPDTWVQLVLWW